MDLKKFNETLAIAEGASAYTTFDFTPAVWGAEDFNSNNMELPIENVDLETYNGNLSVKGPAGVVKFDYNDMVERTVDAYNEYEKGEDEPAMTKETINILDIDVEAVGKLTVGAGGYSHVPISNESILKFDDEYHPCLLDVNVMTPEGTQWVNSVPCNATYVPSDLVVEKYEQLWADDFEDEEDIDFV